VSGTIAVAIISVVATPTVAIWTQVLGNRRAREDRDAAKELAEGERSHQISLRSSEQEHELALTKQEHDQQGQWDRAKRDYERRSDVYERVLAWAYAALNYAVASDPAFLDVTVKRVGEPSREDAARVQVELTVFGSQGCRQAFAAFNLRLTEYALKLKALTEEREDPKPGGPSLQAITSHLTRQQAIQEAERARDEAREILVKQYEKLGHEIADDLQKL
jgi:hypothetical protein